MEPSKDTTPRRLPTDYPEWVCCDCGKRYGRRSPTYATWHQGECEICGLTKTVTEPRDFGHLKNGWHFLALESMALEVVRCAGSGDQSFVECLHGDDDSTKRLRSAIVSLTETLKTAF